MTQYSVQSREKISVKGYGFLCFARNIGKSIGKKIKKKLVVNIARIFLIMLKNLQQMQLKLVQKE